MGKDSKKRHRDDRSSSDDSSDSDREKKKSKKDKKEKKDRKKDVSRVPVSTMQTRLQSFSASRIIIKSLRSLG